MTDYKISALSALLNPQPNVKLPVVDPNDTSTVPAGSAGSDKTVTLQGLYQPLVGSHDIAGGMTAWLTVLGKRHYVASAVTVIGDSVPLFGATTWERTFPIMLQDALNNRFPSNGLSTHGRGLLIPILQTVYNPDYVVITGSPAASSGTGFNLNSWDFSSGGGCHAVYSLVGTTAYITYEMQSGGGTFSWKVDSGTATNVSTNGTAGPNFVGPISLGGGSHTLTVTYVSGGSTLIGAVTEYNGDENAGLQVYNCSYPGSTSANWAAMDFRAIATGGAAMYVIELGGNDWGNGVAVATFSANLTTILNALITANSTEGAPVPQFILMPIYQIEPSLSPSAIAPWSSYVAAMYAVAAGRTDTSVLDLSIRLPQTVTGGGPYGEYATDGEHPSDIGHSVIADIMCAYLGPQ